MAKKIAFHNLGCKVNAYEYERMQQLFQKKGYEIVAFDEKADIYIVNTCTVTNIADRKSRQMLHKAKALNPDAVVVACGCYVETGKNIAGDDSIDIAIGNKDKDNAVLIVEKYIDEKCADSKCTVNSTEKSEKDNLPGEDECDYNSLTDKLLDHTRVYIKVQDGCNQFCSYCIIPYARGRICSRAIQDVVNEVKGFAANGYKEIVLTGIHLSSYGLDFHDEKGYGSYNEAAKEDGYTNRELLELIEKCALVEGVERIRLGSLEPRAMTDDFLSGIASVKEFCPHFHLSLQSGSDSVLARMNRKYSSDEFYERVLKIRKYFDHPAITTDVIVGFPGETEEEFADTKEFVNKVDFYETHIFKYSRRHGTVADKMPGQLTEKQKTERSKILIDEGLLRKDKFREFYNNKEVEILVEETQEIDSVTYNVGYSKEYVRFAVKATKEDMTNRMICGKVSGILNSEFMLMV